MGDGSICTDCQQEFGSADALGHHTKAKHPELVASVSSRSFPWKWVALAAVLIVIFAGGYYYWSVGDSSTEGITAQVVSVPDGPIHWHAKLTIMIDGQRQDIPIGIGLGSVHMPVHTHESDGTIHMENSYPTEENMKLGYFFELWDRTFTSTCIFDYCTDQGILKMSVNGVENFDFGEYSMRDGDEILIEYTSDAA